MKGLGLFLSTEWPHTAHYYLQMLAYPLISQKEASNLNCYGTGVSLYFSVQQKPASLFSHLKRNKSKTITVMFVSRHPPIGEQWHTLLLYSTLRTLLQQGH